MRLLSMNNLDTYKLTRIEQKNIVAKGTRLDGGPDTDGEEDCFPPPPPGSDLDKKRKYCIPPPATI